MHFSLIANRSFARVLNLTLPIAFLIILVVFRLIDPGHFFEKVKLSVFDAYVTSDTSKSPVVNAYIPQSYLVAIDDASLKKYGQWPWSREKVSEILITLYEKGASVVAIDLIFAELDRLSPDAFLRAYDFEENEIKRFSNTYGYTNTDEFLSDVLKQTPTVLAATGADESTPLSDSVYSFATINAELDHLPSIPGMNMPNPVIRNGMSHLGHDVIFNDVDGTLRKIPGLITSGGEAFPSLFISVLASLQNTNTLVIKGQKERPWELSSIKVGHSIIPVSEDASFILKPKYIPELHESLSLIDVLSGAHDKKIKDAILILGPTAAGLAAQHDVSGKLSLPGSYLHVGALEQTRASDFVYRTEGLAYLEVVFGMLIGLMAVYLVMAFSGFTSAVMVSGLAAVVIFAGNYAYQEYSLLADWSFSLIALIIAFLATQIIRVLRHENEKGEIRKAFSTYLNPQLVNELANHPEKLKLGGERKEVTLLFADIRGFTSLSENYADRPEELTSILNKLLTPLTDCIIQNEGTIDKYMGDAIMAFWNAPLDIQNPNQKALLAACEMLDELKKLNKDLLNKKLISNPLELGIGVNSGPVIVGNLGSDQRFDYSCIGDAVNLASRIEGLTKQYGIPILFGQSVASSGALSDNMICVLVDKVSVVGKQNAENIYSIFQDDKWVSLHSDLWQQIENDNWSEAESLINQLSGISSYPVSLLAVVKKRVTARDSVPHIAKMK